MPRPSFSALVSAGAPAVEEPLFYRVTPAPKRDALAVSLRRRKSLGSEVLALRFVYLAGIPAAEVEGAVVSAMISAHDEVSPMLAHAAAVEAIVGTHAQPQPVDHSPEEEAVFVETARRKSTRRTKAEPVAVEVAE